MAKAIANVIPAVRTGFCLNNLLINTIPAVTTKILQIKNVQSKLSLCSTVVTCSRYNGINSIIPHTLLPSAYFYIIIISMLGNLLVT